MGSGGDLTSNRTMMIDGKEKDVPMLRSEKRRNWVILTIQVLVALLWIYWAPQLGTAGQVLSVIVLPVLALIMVIRILKIRKNRKDIRILEEGAEETGVQRASVPRPAGITVISWLYILWGMFGLAGGIGTAIMLQSTPVQVKVSAWEIALQIILSGCSIIGGIGALNIKAWSYLLLITVSWVWLLVNIWFFLTVGIGLMQESGEHAIVVLINFLLFVAPAILFLTYLYRQRTKEYFSKIRSLS